MGWGIAIAAIISFATITTLWLLHPKVALAASFTVNSTADGVDANPGDGSCDDGAGSCTLRSTIWRTPSTEQVPRLRRLSISLCKEFLSAIAPLEIARRLRRRSDSIGCEPQHPSQYE